MNRSTGTPERFWLDEEAECPTPPGRLLIDNEVEFLRQVTLDEPLFVRGESLCRWARGVAFARRWSVRSVQPFTKTLLDSHPDFDQRTARVLAEQLGDYIWQLPVPFDAADVLAALHGEIVRQGAVGAAHAARWLVWWVDQQLEGPSRDLAAAAGKQWATEVNDSFLYRCYAVRNVAEAETQLDQWLGLLLIAPPISWPGVELPDKAQDYLLRRFRRRLVQSGLSLEVPSEEWLWQPLQDPVAHLIADYLVQHPDRLTDQWLTWLGRYITQAQMDELWSLQRPDDPGDLPVEALEIVAWYKQRYLPWRIWASTSRDGAALQRSKEIGSAFATWYLEALPKMLAGASDQERLAWVRALRLKDDPELLTLLVVADGLAPQDMDTLLRHMRNRVPLLRVMTVDWAFAQIPTVTTFTKKTLVTQELTGRLVDEHDGASSYRVTPVIELLRKASPGDVVAWVLVEPDRAYHRTHDQSELSGVVDERLYGIAGHLNTIVEAVPPETKLQVVVTADHGRLLGDAGRTIPVPDGLQPHGRAAWGKKMSDEALTDAFRVEGNVVWLHARTYGLPADESYAVIMDDQAFVTADGKRGVERFPHGGLYPEEVLVPWVVLRRDVQVEQISVTITGEGIVNQLGNVSVTVANPNAFAVEIAYLSLTAKGTQGHPTMIPLDESVGAMSTRHLVRPLAPWPNVTGDDQVRAILIYRLPDGGTREIECAASLMSKALYRENDILSDLP
jgi:hypothetical protein